MRCFFATILVSCLLICIDGTNCLAQDIVLPPTCSAIYSDGYQALSVYPPLAVENCVSGRTVVKFKVSTDGAVSDISIESGVSVILDNEAKSIIRQSSGRWAPGTVNGKPQEMYITQTFIYELYEAPKGVIMFNSSTHMTADITAHCSGGMCHVRAPSSNCSHGSVYYYNEGVKLSQKGHDKEALKMFEKSAMMNYNDIHTLYNIAVIHINQGEGAFACPYLYRIEKIGGKDVSEMVKQFCSE